MEENKIDSGIKNALVSIAAQHRILSGIARVMLASAEQQQPELEIYFGIMLNAVRIVLAHLYNELDSRDCVVEDIGDAQDDSKIFEELLVLDLAGASCNHEDSGVDSELNNLKIFSIHVDSRQTSNNFCGAGIDSGAQRTVFEITQARIYMQTTGDKTSF